MTIYMHVCDCICARAFSECHFRKLCILLVCFLETRSKIRGKCYGSFWDTRRMWIPAPRLLRVFRSAPGGDLKTEHIGWGHFIEVCMGMINTQQTQQEGQYKLWLVTSSDIVRISRNRHRKYIHCLVGWLLLAVFRWIQGLLGSHCLPPI